MARLGFNVVRLGMTWKGLEPGTVAANDPAICRRGTPQQPAPVQPCRLRSLRDAATTTVDLLGRFHIYTILDMHQDVYNELFEGEGEPNWAVCTDNKPSVDPPGRWSLEYGTAAAGIAFSHFWHNNVGATSRVEYDRMWGLVARAFRANPWVLGYDPFNEPFSTSLIRFGDAHFDAQLECFYTGTGHVGDALARRAAAEVPDRRPGRRRRTDDPGQRPPSPDLRRARQLRQPRLPDVSRARWTSPTSSSTSTSTAGPAARSPGTRPTWTPAPTRRSTRSSCGRPTARHGLAVPTRRAGLVRHRVRRVQQPGALGA